jgi:hypothetical protein
MALHGSFWYSCCTQMSGGHGTAWYVVPGTAVVHRCQWVMALQVVSGTVVH